MYFNARAVALVCGSSAYDGGMFWHPRRSDKPSEPRRSFPIGPSTFQPLSKQPTDFLDGRTAIPACTPRIAQASHAPPPSPSYGGTSSIISELYRCTCITTAVSAALVLVPVLPPLEFLWVTVVRQQRPQRFAQRPGLFKHYTVTQLVLVPSLLLEASCGRAAYHVDWPQIPNRVCRRAESGENGAPCPRRLRQIAPETLARSCLGSVGAPIKRPLPYCCT